MNYKIWQFDIDFNNPLLYQNKMVDIVEKEIEPNSPLGSAMGVENNIGEGIVCVTIYKGNVHRWKVKGDKHSKTKVKKLKVVDEALEKKKIEFANMVCTPARLEQAWDNTFGLNNEKEDPNIKFMGNFLKAVMSDVIKEESDIMADMGLEPKMVGSKVSNIAKVWFMEQLNKDVFGS
jgi:hypothetical protein